MRVLFCAHHSVIASILQKIHQNYFSSALGTAKNQRRSLLSAGPEPTIPNPFPLCYVVSFEKLALWDHVTPTPNIP